MDIILIDPPHHRDHDAPCQGCGARWEDHQIIHADDCGFLAAIDAADPDE